MEESRLRIKSVTITGMHKVGSKKYEFNDDITYFIGENGAGKSTILQAVQLGLLGYIPGYAKTNEAIMKHASGNVMSIELDLDPDCKIIRTWTKSGASVKSTVDITNDLTHVGGGSLKPEEFIQENIGDILLPVFDFNEFRSMTANKLKDWFITFLPNSDDKLDIVDRLKESVADRSIPIDDLIADIEKWIKNSHMRGSVDLVRKLNEKLKEDQTYVKGQIASLQGTVQSLIKYDDVVDLDDSEINEEIQNLNALKNQLMRFEANSKMRQNAEAAFNDLKNKLPADRFEDDPRSFEQRKKLQELSKKNEVLKADFGNIQSQISELKLKKMGLPKAGANCPYNNEPCETAAKLLDKVKEQADEIDKQIAFKEEELKDCDDQVRSGLEREMMMINAELGAIQSEYDKLISVQMQLDGIEDLESPTTMSLEEIDTKLADLNNKLVQIAANKKYDELSEKVRADKFKFDNELEIYKVWVKLTDANGLQTELMNKPFTDLASDMSEYLSKMFNKTVTAKFNLIAKANSFSFGLENDGHYIEFDYLSSGEKCLFTLALIMCLLNRSESNIRTILIDDILDHLDSDNANYLFNALKNVDDIQFILAGVKECNVEEICKSV